MVLLVLFDNLLYSIVYFYLKLFLCSECKIPKERVSVNIMKIYTKYNSIIMLLKCFNQLNVFSWLSLISKNIDLDSIF